MLGKNASRSLAAMKSKRSSLRVGPVFAINPPCQLAKHALQQSEGMRRYITITLTVSNFLE